MVIDHHNRVCDRQEALLIGHHDHQHLDVTIAFNNFNSFTTFSRTIFVIF